MSRKKKNQSMLAIIYAAMLCVCFAACVGSDSDDGLENTDQISEKDPEGTIVVNMRNGKSGNFIDIGIGTTIHINGADNFSGAEFVSVGKVSGLSKVNSIPTSGWSNSIAVVPGTGYFVRNNGNYARLYVVDYTVSTEGEILGATIKYQSPYQQKIDIDVNSLTFGNIRSSQVVKLKVPTHLKPIKKPDWCSLETMIDQITITVNDNTESERSGDIVLGNCVNEVTISITQKSVASIELESNSVSFSGEAGSQTIKFRNPIPIVGISGLPDWCTINSNTEALTINVLENASASQYTCEITLENSVSSAKLKIIQKASSNPKFENGRGTVNDPYQIKNAQQLENIGLFLESNYILSSDIDLKSHLNSSSTGWQPIGKKDKPFSGTLDGKGHVIQGIWINRPSNSYIGLFGYIESAIIENIKLFIGEKSIKGLSFIGGLYGNGKNSKINKCLINGSLNGDGYIGGICGVCTNDIISQCYINCDIFGTNDYLAGICGKGIGAYISECFVGGSLKKRSGNDRSVTNCFCGLSENVTKSINCYSTSSLTSGGFGGNITNCYYAGKVEYQSRYYGFGGNNSYYDADLAGFSGNNGRTTAQMKSRSNYEEWDFENIWIIVDGKAYPTLRCFKELGWQ